MKELILGLLLTAAGLVGVVFGVQHTSLLHVGGGALTLVLAYDQLRLWSARRHRGAPAVPEAGSGPEDAR